MVKSKTILSIFLAFCVGFISIFFFAMPSTKQNITISSEVSQVLADEVGGTNYYYYGSDIVIPYMEYWHKMNSNNVNVADMLLLSVTMNYDSYNDSKIPYIQLTGSLFATNYAYSTWSPCDSFGFSRVQPSSTSTIIYEKFNPLNHKFYNYGGGVSTPTYSSTAISNGDFIYLMCNNTWRGNTAYQYYWKANVALSWSEEFSPEFNIQSVILGATAWNGTSCTNYIQYNSANGYWFKISFYTFDSQAQYFNTRTYYLSQDSDNFNIGYNSGWSDGYNTGLNEGNSSGYSEGYNVGYSQGETNGYNDGLEAGSSYTFMSLISATVDAPIQAFLGLFDFEVFGVDMKKFILGLVLLSIVFIIIRLVIKGGR